ncbi:MAG: T9SS type A sorting domain-containing protein, partial [Saprospiraceae bacterium]|nr:T9SS type A sorting domain-containing protein [Saprospiraceae bacterium]
SGHGGDLLYRWGNPQSYGASSPENRMLFGQHDATWIKHGQDQRWAIMLYNNGIGRPGMDYSEVNILVPPLNDQGTYDRVPGFPFDPLVPDWTIDQFDGETFFSSNVSGAYMTPNGTIIMCVGQTGTLLEADTLTKSPQWKYISPISNNAAASQGTFPQSNNLFKVRRYGEFFPGFEGKELISQGPLELNPLPSNCVITDIEEIEGEIRIPKIFPNPSSGIVNLESAEDLGIIRVWDQRGNLLRSQKSNKGTLDLSNLPAGVYFLKAEYSPTQRVVLLPH